MDFVSLANNHVLDFGPEALLRLLELLDRPGVAHAGAGRGLEEALRPALLRAGPAPPAGGLTVGVIGVTDNCPDWEAGAARPGTHFVDHDGRGLTEPYRRRLTGLLEAARRRGHRVGRREGHDRRPRCVSQRSGR